MCDRSIFGGSHDQVYKKNPKNDQPNTKPYIRLLSLWLSIRNYWFVCTNL